MFELTEADKASDLRHRFSVYMKDRLADMRVRNDLALSGKETARIRGRIAELKFLIEQLDPIPPIEIE